MVRVKLFNTFLNREYKGKLFRVCLNSRRNPAWGCIKRRNKIVHLGTPKYLREQLQRVGLTFA